MVNGRKGGGQRQKRRWMASHRVRLGGVWIFVEVDHRLTKAANVWIGGGRGSGEGFKRKRTHKLINV